MKTLRLFLTVFGGLVLTIGLTLIFFLFSSPDRSVQAGGAIRYVATTGSDAGNDCLDSGNPCATPQHAVDVANNGDEILISPGEFTGTIIITKSLSLLGAGQDMTFLGGGGTSSVIQIIMSTTNVISGMTIFNAAGYDVSGLLNQGKLSVINTALTENHVDGYGGAIKNYGILTLTNSLVYTNTSQAGNIYNLGTIFISGSTIQENYSSNLEGGGISNYGTMTIFQSNIAKNFTRYFGGGIYNGGHLTILNSSIMSNTADINSSSGLGGGIFNHGNLAIKNSEISGNNGYSGGGIYQNYPAPDALLINVTILNNSSYAGGKGIEVAASSITIQNSIIAQNGNLNCFTYGGTGSITSLGNNLATDDSCNLTLASDLENTDPKSGFLNSQKTVWFHPLLIDSPAIDKGNDTNCPSMDIRSKTRPIDGNFDGIEQCDIGAYEFILPPLQIVGPNLGQINAPIKLEARITVLTLTTPITYNWSISELAPISHTSAYTDSIIPQWSTLGTKVISVQATGSNGIQLTATKTLDILYQIFLPTTVKPWAPKAGRWDTGYGYFYVTEDQKYIDEFSVFFDIPNCGSVRIYTTELVPITNYSFSFNNFTTYYASGTFDSATTSSGVFGLDDVYIGPCGVRWTIPLTNWTAIPDELNFQRPHDEPYETNVLPENWPYKVELLNSSK